MSTFCDNCGKYVSDFTKFCSECGAENRAYRGARNSGDVPSTNRVSENTGANLSPAAAPLVQNVSGKGKIVIPYQLMSEEEKMVRKPMSEKNKVQVESDEKGKRKEIKLKIAVKKAELAGLTNGGAWVLIIVGVITAIIVIGIVLILVGLYILHKNSKKTEKLNKEIAFLEAELD